MWSGDRTGRPERKEYHPRQMLLPLQVLTCNDAICKCLDGCLVVVGDDDDGQVVMKMAR